MNIMEIKTYNGLTPIIKFYKDGNEIIYKYNDQLYKGEKKLEILKSQLVLPYKFSFYEIPIEIVENILKIFNNDDVNLFWYREKSLNNYNLKNYHAIFLKKVKVKRK